MMPSPTSGQRPAPGIAVDRELELARLRAAPPAIGGAPRGGASAAGRSPDARVRSHPARAGAPPGRDGAQCPAAIVAAAPPSSGTVFLDTETTGLAGGTGTYVFLVGLATWTTARTVTVTQYFLGDLGAEAAFLHAVREAVTAARELVTFNGRTFDLPLLETAVSARARELVGRRAAPPGSLPRRASALARTRGGLPAARPSRTRCWGSTAGTTCRGARPPGLLPLPPHARSRRRCLRIFRHNRWDLVALAGLHARAAALLDGPGSAPRSRRVDGRGALARAAGARPERALLRGGARAGLPVALEPGSPGGSAGSGGERGGSARRGPSGRRRWRAPSAAAPAPDRPGQAPRAPRARLRRRARPDAGRPPDRRGVGSRGRGLVEALERRAHRLTRRLARAVAPGGRGDAPPG